MRPPLLALALALPLAAASAQERGGPPTLQVGVDLVKVSVSVTDRRHNFVTGLQESDFALYEDGQAQKITLFTSQENAPVTAIFMVDASVSMEARLPAVRKGVAQFVSRLSPQDRVKVVQFSDRVRTLQDFSSDRAAIENAFGAIRTGGDTRLHNAVYTAIKELGVQGRTELRRRAVVLVSDGEDTSSLLEDDQVLLAAENSEVTVYVVSLGPSPTTVDTEDTAQGRALRLFRALADETGGKVYFPSISDIGEVCEQIGDELRRQYVIGYVPANPEARGRWRTIQIALPRQRNLVVRHRLGYFEKKR